jgi:methionyl-tRNA formyltransferase
MSKAESLRLVFAGTPEFAALHLRYLLGSRHQVVAVYTQPDRPAGRGKKLTPSPVKSLALEAGLPIYQPATLKDAAAQETLSSINADLMVVVAYGLILPQAVLDIPPYGCINVHASLLPRWRGAAPIQRAIEAGDTETGITIMQMEAGLDTGPMLAKKKLAISGQSNAAQLHDALATAGGPLLVTVLDDMESHIRSAEKQDDDLATYAHKIEKNEAHIDWSRDASTLERQVRAFNPFPICWSTLDDQRLKIWEATAIEGAGDPGEILSADDRGLLVACGEGALLLSQLQLPGGKAMPTSELLRSRRDVLAVGRRLGQ